jgi:hypothetical protein
MRRVLPHAGVAAFTVLAGCTALSGADALRFDEVEAVQGSNATSPAESTTSTSGKPDAGVGNGEAAAAPKPRIAACSAGCPADRSDCCADKNGAGTCAAPDEGCADHSTHLLCDGPEDCGPGEACCIVERPFQQDDAECRPRDKCGSARVLFCASDADCDADETCTGTSYGARVCTGP